MTSRRAPLSWLLNMRKNASQANGKESTKIHVVSALVVSRLLPLKYTAQEKGAYDKEYHQIFLVMT